MNIFSPLQKLPFKQKLKDACIAIIQQRINTAQKAMELAQDAANSGDKSSAGDKYETARAMGQLDREMNAKQLEEAKRDLKLILDLQVTTIYLKVAPGAVVICDKYLFFIALGLGTITIDGHEVVTLSPKAPVAMLLQQKRPGDTFTLNQKELKIADIF